MRPGLSQSIVQPRYRLVTSDKRGRETTILIYTYKMTFRTIQLLVHDITTTLRVIYAIVCNSAKVI